MFVPDYGYDCGCGEGADARCDIYIGYGGIGGVDYMLVVAKNPDAIVIEVGGVRGY